MIYHLFEYLRTATNIPGAGVMQYISTRAEPQLAEFGYLTMLPIGELRKNGYTLPSIVMGLRSNHFRL